MEAVVPAAHTLAHQHVLASTARTTPLACCVCFCRSLRQAQHIGRQYLLVDTHCFLLHVPATSVVMHADCYYDAAVLLHNCDVHHICQFRMHVHNELLQQQLALFASFVVSPNMPHHHTMLLHYLCFNACIHGARLLPGEPACKCKQVIVC